MSVYETDIEAVRFTDSSLVFDLTDGRSISAPLAYYPTLLNATDAQRRNFKIIHHIVHWPDLDADLSSDCLLQGVRELTGDQRLDAVAESPEENYRTERD